MGEDELYVRKLVKNIRIVRKGSSYHIRGHAPPNYSFYQVGQSFDTIWRTIASRIKSEFTISNDKPRA